MTKKLSRQAKNERDFFNRLAANYDIYYYWGWKTKIGQYRHDLRARIIIRYLNLNGKIRVLELGCYTGELTRKLASSGASIYGMDIAPKSVDIAKKIIKEKNIQFFVDNIESSQFSSNYFNAVTGIGILHHTNLKYSLKELKRILKSGGKFIFFEPNMLNPEIFLERKVPLLRKLTNTSPDETAFIRWKLEKKLQKAGFIRVSVQPFDYIYPAFPSIFLPLLKIIDKVLTKLPLIREFAGSLIVMGEKPETA